MIFCKAVATCLEHVEGTKPLLDGCMSSPKILDMDLFLCSKPGVGSAADDPQATSA